VQQLGLTDTLGLLAPEYDVEVEAREEYIEALMGSGKELCEFLGECSESSSNNCNDNCDEDSSETASETSTSDVASEGSASSCASSSSVAGPKGCIVQVLRSLGPTTGSELLEQSVHTRYIDLIATSQHFIYIEQQFFITSLPGLSNQIGTALFERISRAIREGETFRVVVVLPIHPSGNWKSGTVRALLRWQSQTIVRHEQSMLRKLQSAFPEVVVEEYISFYGLVNHGKVGDSHFIEQIYVHSKLMIVDDRVVVCGSANINDRSMTGDRDSEIAVACADSHLLSSTMAGKPFLVSRFAHRLRIKVTSTHLRGR
jgi:phospholipase D1/2